MPAGDITQLLGSSAAFTISLASLATSSTRVAGRESTEITLASLEPVIDVLISGKIRAGTTPTANKIIDVWVWGSFNDTPLRPDTITGTDANVTLTSENVRNAGLHQLLSALVDNTSDRFYYLKPVSLARVFGGVLPKRFGLFVTHDTAVALHATAGDHALYYTPVYHRVAQS